ncbi:5'-3' exonuclease [Rhodopirellula bahusiensis]|uniref:5'-3' exonuclease n=1 Tax=Rhodopirellula bahusiensis TaxID=2014065 RepID=UPI003263B0F9
MTEPIPLRILIDGTNMAHRDFHAAGLDRIASITRRRMQAFREQWKPERVMAAFDLSEKTFRHELHADYKAGRTPPPEIDSAIQTCQESLLDSCVDVVSSPGFEADDVIATLTRIALQRGRRVLVYSADKDLHQLITPGSVTQLTACRREHNELRCVWQTDETLQKKFGVRASQWIDFRTMTGDSSDNLPGIARIGADTAR